MDTDILYNNEERLLKARDLIEEWENIPARRILEEILESDPLCEEAYFLLGLLYESRYALFDMALTYYETALRINKNYAEARLACMRLMNRCGRSDEVISLYSGLQYTSVFGEMMLFEAVIAQEKLGNYKEAIRLMDMLRRVCTHQSRWENLAEQKLRLLEKLTEEANQSNWQ